MMFIKAHISIQFIRTVLLWFILLSILAVHQIISLHDNPGSWTDSFIYLLQADYLSNWNTEHLPAIEQAIAYRNFPPLYPYFLSIFNAGSDNMVLASAATSFLLLPFCFFYIAWQVKEGVEKEYALINAIIFVLLPSALLLSTEIWSENLYLVFTVSTLWCFSRFNNQDNRKWLYAASFTCGLALITRSIGVALVFALLIKIYQLDRRKLFIAIIIMFMPWLIWAFLSQDINYGDKYIDSGLVERYKGFLITKDGILAGVTNIIKVQLKTFWLGLQLQFNNQVNYRTMILSLLIITTSCMALLERIKKLSLDAIYITVYLGIILVWYYPDQNVRFIYAIIPIILFYSHLPLSSLAKLCRKNKKTLVNLSAPLIIIITILPFLIFMSGRLINPPGGYIQHFGNDRLWLTGADTAKTYKDLIYKERLTESAIKIKEIVPQDECIYSIYHEIIMLYSKRRSVVPPLQHVSQYEFNKKLNQCRYIFIIGAPHLQHEPLYPVDRVINDTKILYQQFFPPEYGGGVISVLLEIDKRDT